MSEGKFLALWTKYLPAIRIVLKKSINEDQQMLIGKMELQSVDSRKNAGYNFDLEILNGKMVNTLGTSALGKDLFFVMSNDSMLTKFMADKRILLKMGKNLQLIFKTESSGQTVAE